MGFLDSVFGAKPEVAGFENIDFGKEQLDSLMENIKAWPDIEKLGNLYQTYMLGQYGGAGLDLKSLISGGAANVAKEEATAQEYLGGNVPQDVADAVQRSSAFQNLQSGGGGTMAMANNARNYGWTSADMVKRGEELAAQAGNSTQMWEKAAGAVVMSPAGFVVTPAQQAEMTLTNRLIQQKTQQMRNNVAAAPDPGLQALNQWIEQVGGTIIGAYATGGMSKGGDYKTSYNAGSYLGGAGASDVSNPGQYVSGGGGGGNASGLDVSAPNMSPVSGGAGAGSGDGSFPSGFDFGVGYPSSNVNQYYGGMSTASGGGQNYPNIPWLYGTADFAGT